MIDITTSAAAIIAKELIGDMENRVIRVSQTGDGCGGPILGLVAGGDLTSSDETWQGEGWYLAVDRDLLQAVGGVRIRYVQSPWGGGYLEVRPLIDFSVGGCGDCRC